MKSKTLFWLLVILVFGSLIGIGFLFLTADIVKFIVVESITILAIILFFILYYRLIKPLEIISSGMELLKGQDFSTRLRPVASSEANRLIEIFNKMMEQLKQERLRMRETNHFLDLLIQASPQGVIILDFDENISEINTAGLRLLNVSDIKNVRGKALDEAGITIGKELSMLLPNQDVVIRSSGITIYRCIRSAFIDQGFSHPFILIEELTSELLKIEKKSYESIIRMMAHEVNNSIGAIGSTLNVISDTLTQNRNNELIDVLPAVNASFDRCKHLGTFISNFADVVKIPLPSFAEVEINELARSVEALTSVECQKRNIVLSLNLTSDNSIVRVDGIQIEQVLVNIIKNAYEAIEGEGQIRIITNLNPKSIIIENNGQPINEETRQMLFTPFFTTKPMGQGIGLMLVREILLNHNFRFELHTVDGWTRFEIYF